MSRTQAGAGIVVGLLAAGALLVLSPDAGATLASSDARLCADQTIGNAAQRINGRTQLLRTGRLAGKSAGVAHGLRGLAYLDRGDVAHAIADLDQAVKLAPDFAPALQNRGNAWYARGNYG